MADQYYDDDDYEVDNSSNEGPANLRKALKKREKEMKALEQEIASLRSANRERSVKEVLETKGVNEKIAKFIPSDITAPEQIAQWLDEHADVFGYTAKGEDAQPELTEQAITDQRILGSTSTGSTPSRDDDLMNKIQSVSSKAELEQLMGITSLGRVR